MDDREYYVPGLWNIYCQSCGRKYKSNEIRKRWDGLYVCDEDWEPRHPQDFVRGVPELSNRLPYTFDNDGVPQGYVMQGTLNEQVYGLQLSIAISGTALSGVAVSGVITAQYY